MMLTVKIAHAQNLNGFVKSSENGVGITGTHIVNKARNVLAISSDLGYFSIKGELGDTLVVSNINFITKQFIVKTQAHLNVVLTPNMIQLEEVIVSNLPRSQAAFRKKLIEMPLQDNGKFVPFGVTPGKPMAEIPKEYNRSITGSLGYAISNPIKFTIKKLSKEYKEIAEHYEIKAALDDTIIRNKKYNRELVALLTGLEGDELTDFINHINLSDSFIDKSSEYEITERIKEEFEEYQIKNVGEQK
jgi:hypothetical protein